MDKILLMNALEKVSRVDAKDCIKTNNVISYLVDEKKVGKAIGKKASNIKKLENSAKQRVEIIGFYKNPQDLVKNTFKVEIKDAKKKGKNLIIEVDADNKKKILGNIGRLKRIQELMKRNYSLNLVIN
jgi:N utilization substance protein A